MKEYPFNLFRGGDAREVKDPTQEARARQEGYTEPYKHQEYPKHLYKNGERQVHATSGEQVGADERVVKDTAEEAAARAAGYRMLGEPAPEAQDEPDDKGEAKGQAKPKKTK